jgi:hypothetical protein
LTTKPTKKQSKKHRGFRGQGFHSFHGEIGLEDFERLILHPVKLCVKAARFADQLIVEHEDLIP